MSVTELIVALPFSANAIVNPPLVKLLPWASFACTVMVEVVLPSAVTEVGAAEMVVCAVVAAPGVKVTVVVSIIADPPIVPLTVITSATVLVIVAV